MKIILVAGAAALLAITACSEKESSGKADRSGNADNVTATGASEPAPAPKHAPNPSKTSPPSPAFAQFERIEAGKFHSTEQFSSRNPGVFFPGAIDNVQYQYVYTDDRFAKYRSFGFDLTLQIVKFPSADQAKAFLDRALAKAIPIAEADRVQLPRCSGEKRAGDDFVGPDKIVRTLPNPRGGQITILHSGDFNMYDCTRGSNRSESAVWTEGEYYFLVNAGPMSGKPDDTGYGRAEELAVDYTNALGPR
jgi:hypothetical protein